MPIKDAIATVLNRNAFYRDGYRILLRLSVIQGLILVLLVAVVVTLVIGMETRYVYFATTQDGRIINIVPLNEPLRTRAEVVVWAAKTAQNTMRFGYSDYRQRLQESASNFTTTGWENFTRALQDARILESIDVRKLNVFLDVEAAPEIKNAFVKDGVYTWIVQFPITIRFDGAADAPTAIRAKLFLQIVRVSTLQSPEGLSIAQWVARFT